MSQNLKKIGIVGYGQFGQFIHKYLEKYFEVFIYKKDSQDLESLKSLDYLIFCVPLSSLEEVCKKFKDIVTEETILIDVTSVKVKPLNLLKIHFLNNMILGTHPIFGPQSGKDGIENLPIVLSNVSLPLNKFLEVKNFLSQKLKLKIIEQTAEQHDKEMAYVHALSHFIGRALVNMDIQDVASATKPYKNLLEIKELLKYDTFDLFKTIQNGNPFAQGVREEFLKNLNDLESKLKDVII